MTIEEFLLERVEGSELLLQDVSAVNVRTALVNLCSQIRLIIDWHKNWPILVETEPLLEHIDAGFGGNQLVYSMTQKIQWMTQEEYRKKFGSEPPTAPLLRQMAALYSWHPDYNTDWEI